MKSLTYRRFGVLSFVMLTINLLPLRAYAQQVWFAPGDDLNVNGVVSHPDYMRLFDDPSTWPVGVAHIHVMQLRAPWVMRNSPEKWQEATKFLASHHIAIAMPMGFVASESCGEGIEGIGTPKSIDFYPRQMKLKGIKLEYITMDEPLFYGHDYKGKNACNFPIPDLAHIVANSMRLMRTYFPEVKFFLTEPPQGLVGGVAELAQFLDDLKADFGEYPAGVRFDMSWGLNDKWHLPWHREMPHMMQMLEQRHLGYGIIFDAGNVNGHIPNTDASWIASAKANVREWQTVIPERPAQVSIQTWSPNPVHIVPESSPDTMTGFLKWYVQTNVSRGAR
jgi:hypothetical protein